MSLRLLQLDSPEGRRLALVEEPHLRLLGEVNCVYDLALRALRSGVSLAAEAQQLAMPELVEYDAVYHGDSTWRVLPSADVPSEAARCLVSGTGLTHKASAKNRDAMHAAAQAVTDSTRMYESGVEGGRPAHGHPGVAPEWFYKGTGSILRGHNEALTVPEYAEDGGEEPEIAGVYIIDDEGQPRRIGFTAGNEFSDHVFEKKNYLYLAASKLRNCAIGPELVIEGVPDLIPGKVSIERKGEVLWSKDIQSGEGAMCHSLANIEHHHFKFEAHRRPGDLHIHFFGADAFSFGEGVQLAADDIMEVRFEGFGRPLRNPLLRIPPRAELVRVTAI